MLNVKQTFKKGERLKSRKMINELFDHGEILYHSPFRVLYKDQGKITDFPAQITISVSKKNFKRAVDRNYIKRKIREAYRKNKHLLYDAIKQHDQKLSFFVIYTAKYDMDYNSIEKEIKLLITKLSNKLARS